MKLIKCSTLTNQQKSTITTIIGLKDNIPTTYAEMRDSLDWNIMQSKNHGRLLKRQHLITISIQESLDDVLTFFAENSLEPYYLGDKNTNVLLKDELTVAKKEKREHIRKKTILNGKFLNTRTKRRGRFHTLDISFRGLKFTFESRHRIAQGDILMISFKLDNTQTTEITRKVRAVYINEKQVGAEMINPPPLDPDLGFYLMH